MPLSVCLEEWQGLTEKARSSVLDCLHEHKMLVEGEDLHLCRDFPRLAAVEDASIGNPDVGEALRLAAEAGMEAVSITAWTHFGTGKDGVGTKDVCFVVAYIPTTNAPATDSPAESASETTGCP
jgi:hypothetical protein